MTLKELKQYDGKNGNQAYVAYKGKVYDVTKSAEWQNGSHYGVHDAGLDLTQAMANAPHADDVFEGFDAVDTLDEEDEEEDQQSGVDWVKWYRKYHPHPMLVHFPIALHLFAVVLDMLFLYNHHPSYATAVFYSLFASTVMGLFAMLSGLLSWWVNYQMVLNQIFVTKILLSIASLILGVFAIALYLNDPTIIYHSSFAGIFYHSTVFATGVMVIILAYNGGKLTWPDEESS